MRHEVPDKLACDFQQYYGCWDFSSFPPQVAAALAGGLPEESRSIRPLAGDGDERPESVVARLMGKDRRDDADTLSFETPEAFEAARANIIQNQQKEVAEHG